MSDKNILNRKININELPKELPDINSSTEHKETAVKKWLLNWIQTSVSDNKIKINDILPSKSELSSYLGVSKGTIQNAVRSIEDEGFLASRQKCGTVIAGKDCKMHGIKSDSKRNKAIIAIKRVIIQKGFKVGDVIPSSRKTGEFLGISQNTARLAYENLSSSGILEYKKGLIGGSSWILKEIPSLSDKENELLSDMYAETLVDKITKSIKIYLSNNFNVGDKIPTGEKFSEALGVSIKTVHDCLKELNKQGIIISRRGKYGSILAQDPLHPVYEPLKENSVFAKAQDSAFYSYKKIENKIVSLIKDNYEAGDKMPSMKELSSLFNVSTNTVRKALINLSGEGYITFERGRYGGTYIVDKPGSDSNETYKWLSVNKDFI